MITKRKIFISCVSAEFRSYRTRLANHLRALRGEPFEVNIQEDFNKNAESLTQLLVDHLRYCNVIVHMVGERSGFFPKEEHVQDLYRYLGEPIPSPIPNYSYSQWEYVLARKFNKQVLIYVATKEAPREALDAEEKEIAPEDKALTDLQSSHLAGIKSRNELRSPFSSPVEFTQSVFHDLGVDLGPRINNLPFTSLGTRFKGREEFLIDLKNILGEIKFLGLKRVISITSPTSVANIYGLGGIGKTRLAVEYAHRYINNFTAVLFIGADSPENLEINLVKLCETEALNLPEKTSTDPKERLSAVFGWLGTHPGWLVILDNVDTDDAAEAVEAKLNRFSHGQVLITSRYKVFSGQVKEKREVGLLSEQDAIAFLRDRARTEHLESSDDETVARELIQLLDRLPLALEQAGAYIQVREISLTEYLALWKAENAKMLGWDHQPADEQKAMGRVMQYSRSVAVTWQTSFSQLRPDSRHLLELLAWLAPDPVPESLLKVPVRESLEEDSPAHIFADALPNLAAYSLVTRITQDRTFSVHRLVQAVTRRNLEQEQVHRTRLIQAVNWAQSAFMGDPRDSKFWPILTPLAGHVIKVCEFAEAEQIEQTGVLYDLYNNAGLFFCSKALYSSAERPLRRVLEMSLKTLGPNDPCTANCLSNLGLLLTDTNRAEEAEQLLRQALAIRGETRSG